jgi:cobalt-precorrin-5B (C1)-methyltransferase
LSGRREGYTTGSCAAAAAKAALLLLARGQKVERVEIPLPGGGGLTIAVESAGLTQAGARAAVRKDAGDDPDVTQGALIAAEVAWSAGTGIEWAAGEGVGTVTRPGLALPPGEPAINPGPRRMIEAALREVTDRGVRVTISIAGGRELAARTFNPRLGIEGGLSVLGTSGVVRPFSCSALRESLRLALNVAAAGGVAEPVLVPGHIGEKAARARYGGPPEGIVEVGNEWGFALDEAAGHPFRALRILGHPGKLAKLAAGHWDTHSGRSPAAAPLVARLHAGLLGRPAAPSPTVEGIFAALAEEDRLQLGAALAGEVLAACTARTRGRFAVAVALIDLAGRTLGEAKTAEGRT